MRLILVLTLVLAAAGARGQPVLDAGAVPGLDAAGRMAYSEWLLTKMPRVFALGSNGKMGWYSGGKTLDEARPRALQMCTANGGVGCRPFAENLAVVWPGREWSPPPVPGPLVDTINYVFTPDARFLWRGPEAARGVVVWSHGNYGDLDHRGLQPPPVLRAFNDAGFDVIRFDRVGMADNLIRATGWLRDELAVLRRSGYHMVVAAGQSRGAWMSLQVLDTAGLADMVIALSPAAHGSWGSRNNLNGQDDDMRAIMADAEPSNTRVVMVQFAGDTEMSDGDVRARLVQRLQRKEGALLLIDRPADFSGHNAGEGNAFAQRYGDCLLRFATEGTPATACPPRE